MALQNDDPNSPSSDDGLFGLPSSEKDSEIVLLPIPFEATTSYLGGTARGPTQIRNASHQLDLFHRLHPNAWKKGIFMRLAYSKIKQWNEEAKALVKDVRDGDPERESEIERIDEIGDQISDWLFEETSSLLEQSKIVGSVGGDHSIPLGAIRAYAKKFPKLGILHIDAHFDLRKAYEGFKHSHASIMYNVLQQTENVPITHVSIRDYCEEEWNRAQSEDRIRSFIADETFERLSAGETWSQICDEIVRGLPEQIYVSFDIDGLDPKLCPQTGTPVPGGMSFLQAQYLLRSIIRSKKSIVGFDLCEVGPSEFDGNIGARVLYELSVLSLVSKD